jgi:hypothetical protein
MVSSVAVGFLWSRYGPRLALSYGGLLALLATAALIVLSRERDRGGPGAPARTSLKEV